MTSRAKRLLSSPRTAPLNLLAAALLIATLGTATRSEASPVSITLQQPVTIAKLPNGDYLLDFGRVAFGNLQLTPPPSASAEITLRLGEAMRDGHIDRTPPGTVRYTEIKAVLAGHTLIVAPRPNPRNIKPPAVLTPPQLGVLTPFRWVEISGWQGDLSTTAVQRRAAFDSTWHDDAATFHSSDPLLDRIWDLCHYSIKATTYAGIFVDGDRERLAYEADAYQNALGYFAGAPDPQMERDTFDRLLQHPTWPTEWAPQMVFIAYADWMQTGDKTWLAQHYDKLKTKLLNDRVGPDSLVHSNNAQVTHGDIVDWPLGERDGYVFTPVNTVVNAFHLQALEYMQKLALALGRNDDAQQLTQQRARELAAFQHTLFDEQTGLYLDGLGTTHSSLHANLFPLAFGLVPQDKRQHVEDFIVQRGMRGSPYAAQFQLEGLFNNGQSTAALEEITAPGDRSWKHMVESGTTITWEAWDQHYKPNQDWNHAWGAAPANLLPRFVLGVQPLEPGWQQAEIAPHPGALQFAEGTVPTPRGPIQVSWKHSATFTLSSQLPPDMKAHVRLPASADSRGVWLNGHHTPAHREGDWWVLDETVTGNASLEVR